LATNEIGKPWPKLRGNMLLLATGNYAVVSPRAQGILLWKLTYTPSGTDRMCQHLMPPPKRLVRNKQAGTAGFPFEGFELQVDESPSQIVDGLKRDQHSDVSTRRQRSIQRCISSVSRFSDF